MASSRTSGILLHPTSLPSRYGIGDLGPEAYRFVDFMETTGQQLWQVLPLGPTGHGNSPYLCYSSTAGNPLLISLEQLRDRNLLEQSDLDNLPDFSVDWVDFDQVAAVKIKLLDKAAETFHAQAGPEDRQAYEEFCQKAFWLDDYAFYMALKSAHDGASWSEWDKSIARREPEAVQEWQGKLAKEISHYKYKQFEFHRQWTALKQYANERNIQIIGDIPIYVAHDSVDVWANPENFMIDPETLMPSEMAGVPPDYFSTTGQLWGNPTYNWKKLEETNFHWWLQRIRAILDYVDWIRIDHFRGFQAYWAVAEGETTAMNGQWIEAPGEKFFNVVKEELGSLPILAEDLGLITPEVLELRDQFDFPGMKILQFAFGSDSKNLYLPFNYPRNCIVYTGTHDNDTTVGWFNQLEEHERNRVLMFLGCLSPDGVHWDLIRVAMMSIADRAIIPMQDLFGLGSEFRMNTPGQAENNWAWRYRPEWINEELCHQLREMTRYSDRAPDHWYQ
ncbi:MAG TPA: 4-alpha-glucanotransferase [Trichocoleus sp.]